MKYAVVAREDEKSLDVANQIKSKLNLECTKVNPDIVIAVGGDGTILKAVHKYPGTIIFGVHTGHLGFYANYSPENINELIDDINNGTYQIETPTMLSCEIEDCDGNIISDEAINEITIVTPLRTLILDVSIDDNYLERFRGTGFCVSTPSGSTAYNKSLHGSVVDCRLNVIQITEIAGINSNSYRTLSSPIILAEDRIVKLESVKGNDEVFITVDHISYETKKFKRLTIKYAGKNVKMAHPNHEGFIKKLNRTFLMSKE